MKGCSTIFKRNITWTEKLLYMSYARGFDPKNEVNIEIYSDTNKKDVADLILHIQNAEFGIPITLELQPDLNEIPGFYQTNSGNFWISKIDKKIIGTISLLDIGNRKAA